MTDLLSMRGATTISREMAERWGNLLRTLTEVMETNIGRIVRTDGLKASTARAPHEIIHFGKRVGRQEAEFFCGKVIRTRGIVDIPDTSCDPEWRGGAGAARGAASYLGMPIFWPDDTLFGVIDSLDAAPRAYSGTQKRLMAQTREHIESHLAILVGQAGHSATELKSREALRVSEERFRLLVDNALDDFFLHDDKGRFLDVNDSACRNLGYTRQELLRMSAVDVSTDLTQAQKEDIWSQTQPGAAATVYSHHRRKNGSLFPVEVRVSCHLIQGQKLFLGMVRNITERVEAEQAVQRLHAELEQRVTERTAQLHETAHRLQAVMDGATAAIFLKDVHGHFLLFNQAAERFTGVAAAQALGRTAGDLFGHTIGARIRRDEIRLIASGKASTTEETLTLQGIERIFLVTKSPRRDADGRVIGLIGIARDITGRKIVEHELRLQRERLIQAEKLARIGSWTLDLTNGQFTCSQMLSEMNGIDPAGPAMTLADLQKLLPADGYRKVATAIERCSTTGQPYDVETEHYRMDGSSFAAHIRGQANYDSSRVITSLTGTVQDITERKEARARLAALADNMPGSAIFRLEHNPQGQAAMLYMSAGILGLIGIAPDKITDDFRAFLRLIHKDDLAGYMAASASALATREPFDHQFRIQKRDGLIIWMQIRSAPSSIRPDGSSVWDGIVRDITKEREAAAALEMARDAAQTAERAKGEFLATMSHEIRTPMNTVIGMTRLTLQTDLSPKQRNYLEKIDASAKTLLGIINDILDYSKIEAGRLDLEDTEFELEAVLDTLSLATVLRAEEKGLEIIYAVAPEVPRTLKGDPLRLSQVLINLVGNAVKFTSEGEIVVAVCLVATAGSQMLQFSVRDTGIGLDADQISGLFQPFTQADSRTSRRYGGTGLGLSISKRLVEKMGGKIEVQSEPGRGSLFRFTIDLVAAPPAAVPDAAHPLGGRRVLIVDDNASAREILADMVGMFGMTSNSVPSGAVALDVLRAASARGAPYDLVLMDWRMPGMDGLEAARRIRADASLRRTPAVLMVTAYGREELLQQVDALDLQGLLIKPVTESMMFNAIQHVFFPPPTISGPEQRKDHPASLVPPERRITGEATGRLLAGRRILLVDDNALNREVATDFLALAGMMVDAAAGGAQALRLLERHTYDAVLMDMHMPDMDGLEATRRIRLNPAWAALPVIALTAQARIEDKEATLRAGMTAHLTKPIDEALLYSTLAGVLAGNAAAIAFPDNKSPAPSDGVGTAPIDLSAALQSMGGDLDRLDRLLRGFLRDFSDVPQRLALSQANSPDNIFGLAHLVKGAAGYLAATGLLHAAENLERSARADDPETMNRDIAEFREQLNHVLLLVRDELEKQAETRVSIKTRAGKQRNRLILPLLERIEPLIACGDYAAAALLAELAAMLAGRKEAALVDEIRSLYDDIELDAANAALARLRNSLTNPSSQKRAT